MGKSKYHLPKNITYRPNNKLKKYMFIKCLNKDQGKFISRCFETLQEAIYYKQLYEKNKLPSKEYKTPSEKRQLHKNRAKYISTDIGYEFFCTSGYSEDSMNRFGYKTWWFYPENPNDKLPENVYKNLTPDSLKKYKGYCKRSNDFFSNISTSFDGE